ncbi:TetR/AcrR family transcriptional regulator [Endozoicomonas arenosclerae]|uniref:TetR/AcrR family transcriptional regulator n=1 Tax=Endozoicomonas arenosclerae TaxID=1633495 RepID=UPI000A3D9B01|nr:TetR/AcrR family transcriptional regulator [Endozoicomonas arenosclerae]
MSESVDIKQLLGIRLEKGDGIQVIAWSDYSQLAKYCAGEVPRWMLTLLAETCVQNGADRASGEGLKAKTVDSSSRFFTEGEGNRFMAVSEPVYKRPDRLAWRTCLYRLAENERQSPEKMVADFSHTFELSRDTAQQKKTAAEKGKTQVAETSSTFLQARPETVADKRRQQIFKGACEVIGRKGYGSASMREIAKAADITIPTMYKYIDTKEDILFMITQVCMEEIFAYFKEALHRQEDAESKMKSAIEAYVQYVTKNRKYINLVYRETRALNAENRDRIFNVERDFMTLWEQIIVDGIEEGVFKKTDTFLAANMIYFFCNVWALRHWSLEGYSEEQIRDRLVEFILPGLS